METRNNRTAYFKSGERRGQQRPAAKSRHQQESDVVGAVFCRACNKAITSRDQKIEMGGTHSHTFFNPAGLVFELGCFRTAPGCRVIGAPSTEFTWFPGHIWRVVLCRTCKVHLGWQFSMEDTTFYGLIRTKLIE
jgi:hypothetical protein